MLSGFPFARRLVIPLIATLFISLILAVFLLGGSWRNAQAGEAPAPALLPDGTALNTCTIGDVSVFDVSPRIHVRCTVGSVVGANTIYYFAAAGDSAHAITTNRFLTLLNTAYALGKQIKVTFDTDSANNPPGCLASDCRKIVWLTTVP